MDKCAAKEWPRRICAVLLAFVLLCLTSLPGCVGVAAWAQSGGERWIVLATRTIDLRVGRASIDLSKTKGAFRAVRIAVKSGALAISQVELSYADSIMHKERRALVLREDQRTRPIGTRSEDSFLERIELRFRTVAGDLDRAVIAIEGLQGPSGAVAVRTPVGSPAPPRQPDAERTEAKPPVDEDAIRSNQARQRKVPEKQTAPAVEAEPPKAGPSAPTAPPIIRATREPWDVVPIFYGTDRNREPDGASAVYGSERARRLDLGRALVTVPKVHQMPKIERPWVYRLPFRQIVLASQREDPQRHFTLREVRSLTKEEFLQLVRERLGPSSSYKDHALVFVHGFNSSFENALYRAAQISYDIKFDGAPFLYSWPSKGTLGLHDYSYDRESSGQAEPYLRQFLAMIAHETGATSMSVIAHSMGSQLLLPVLRDLKHAAPPGVTVSQVILAAPDVDRDAFENIARELTGATRGITMFAAGNDLALAVSRRFWGGVPRAGDVPPGGPVITEGVDTIDITAVSTQVFALNHSGYADKIAPLADIQILIQTGERPPDKRVPILERVKTKKGDYWRYPALSR